MPNPLLAHSLIIAVLTALPAVAIAQSGQPGAVPTASSTPDIETSKYSFIGEVNDDNTLIRSGPSENDYQVLKVSKGTRLTVVGMVQPHLVDAPFVRRGEAGHDELGAAVAGAQLRRPGSRLAGPRPRRAVAAGQQHTAGDAQREQHGRQHGRGQRAHETMALVTRARARCWLDCDMPKLEEVQ